MLPLVLCEFNYFIAQQLDPVTRMKNIGVFPELLDSVADCVSNEYLQIGIELGFSATAIKRFRQNNRTNTLENHQRDAEGVDGEKQKRGNGYYRLAGHSTSERKRGHQQPSRLGGQGVEGEDQRKLDDSNTSECWIDNYEYKERVYAHYRVAIAYVDWKCALILSLKTLLAVSLHVYTSLLKSFNSLQPICNV